MRASTNLLEEQRIGGSICSGIVNNNSVELLHNFLHIEHGGLFSKEREILKLLFLRQRRYCKHFCIFIAKLLPRQLAREPLLVMLKIRPLSQYAIYTALIFLLLAFQTCNARQEPNNCAPSLCGTINIRHPFRLHTDPINCGDQGYNLYCENNSTAVLYLRNSANLKDFVSANLKYYVQEIDYNNSTIRVVDAGFDKYNCSSLPHVPLRYPRYSLNSLFFGTDYSDHFGGVYNPYAVLWRNSPVVFVKCANPVKSPRYLNRRSAASCRNGSAGVAAKSAYESSSYNYAITGHMFVSELMERCTIEMTGLMSLPLKNSMKMSFLELHRQLAYGFELKWCDVRCRLGCLINPSDEVRCFRLVEAIKPFSLLMGLMVSILGLPLVLLQATKASCGTPCVIALLIYKWRRRHLSADDHIEEFLRSQNNFMPVRYSYSDIKKMTRNFKDKLGEGGFGSVFKAKLRSGGLAAIKLLGKSKGNGQEFINEVATIGRIHHTNVVRLIGFCVEGSKRALVYEFMPNGSLNNYIFPGKESISLSWEMLYEISLGIARGIEYLHRGCDVQILHFDIKPHNILLDENFQPKVSDFGLAKLYPKNGIVESLTAARGTIGYIAPELFYKNIGRVSYKADVYSFGMLLLEMAGKRKNLDATAKNSSQIYFPFWIYDQLLNGKAIGNEDATEEESRIAEKMIVVGLWCIQMQPNDRPPMNKVVEMLEGDLESLELPQQPTLYPEEMPMKDEGANHDQPSISSSVVDPIESINSIVTCSNN